MGGAIVDAMTNIPRHPVAGLGLLLVLGLGPLLLGGCAPPTPAADTDGATTVESLFEAGRSDVVVEVDGIVQRTLSDDTEASRHQRFIVRLPTGRTLLVAHNIDLADRVPLTTGDAVRLRGEYEWNDQGGVVHWTHHDPRGERPGGWIEHEGRRYR